MTNQTKGGRVMGTVTGKMSKSDVLELAEKVIQVCREHTSSDVVARGAIQIADTVIASEAASSLQSPEAQT